MDGFSNNRTFFHRYKIFVINLLLMTIIAGVDPYLLTWIPDTEAINYYIGVGIIAILFFEIIGVWYKSRLLFSMPDALYHKIPWYIHSLFLPRVIFSGIIATLALESMGALEASEFFLIIIVLYAAAKEFWVRSVLLTTEREKSKRPTMATMVLSELAMFTFLTTSYFAIWKVYLLETPRIMYLVLSPINWPFAAIALTLLLFAFEMPYFWEDALRPKTRAQRALSFSSLLFPAFGLIIRFYLLSYLPK